MTSAFIFAFFLLGSTLAIRYFLKKKGIVDPAPTRPADFALVFKILALVPLFTTIIISGYFLKRRLETRVYPITTIFFKENRKLRGVVVELVSTPALYIRTRRVKSAFPKVLELKFKLFDFSEMEKIAELEARPFLRTELLPADFMTYLGRTRETIWIETDTQGLVAINGKNLEVTDEAEIARRNPSFPLVKANILKRGFDPDLERPYIILEDHTLIVNPVDFSFTKAVKPIERPVNSKLNFDCEGRRLTAHFEIDSESRDGAVFFRVLRHEKNGTRTVIEKRFPAERTAGFCLDEDRSLYVLGVTGDTFPVYNITRLAPQ